MEYYLAPSYYLYISLRSYYILMIFKEQKWIWEGGKTPPNWSDVEPVIKNIQRVKEFEE